MFTRTESHDMRLLTSCGNKNKKPLRFTVSHGDLYESRDNL